MTGSGGAGGTGAAATSLEELLHGWLPAQRWYPAKGRGVGLRLLGSWRMGTDGHPAPAPGSAEQVQVEVHVIGLDSGDRTDVVQVPLSLRSSPRPELEASLVGRLQPAGGGTRWVYDGPHDPAYVSQLLASLDSAGEGEAVPADAPSRVLRGEQSNTSIIVEPPGRSPSIVKVFRTLHPGANPDVEVTGALSRVGCPHVPSLRGWQSGSWTTPTGEVSGHLAVAVEFLPGSEDAWRVALAAVRAGEGFVEQARGLGSATASVHLSLAEAFGTVSVSPAERDRTIGLLQERVRWARSSVSELDPLADALAVHLGALADLPELPPLQRVHGDLHLGQVLHAPGTGWVLLDFEGEPLRPLAERSLPDLALRDVAGMLRSFDYAAQHDLVDGPGRDPEQVRAAETWASQARDAFCEGYATTSGRDPRQDAALLRALELDKALYEAVYEARNRPSWLPIPLAAVTRLLA